MVCTRLYATHAAILTSLRSTPASADASLLKGTLPYRPPCGGPIASATGLSPDYCRREITRPVSYYALFQGWLLLSQPPGCFGDLTSFATEPVLGGLSGWSGLFPSRRWRLSVTVSLPGCGAMVLGVWLGLVSLCSPLAHPGPYPHGETPEAAPQCISGRTSYLRARLAFHRYPQLILGFCHIHRFAPPRGFTPASHWPWVDRPVSGLIIATGPPEGGQRPIQTRFRCGSRTQVP